jgi:integrase
MARTIGRLTARQVATAKPESGKRRAILRDGGNLHLELNRNAAGDITKSWLFEYALNHKRHWVGLGPTHTVSLREARDRARALRQQLLDGVDPLAEKRRRERQAQEEQEKIRTFREAAKQYLALHLAAFRNVKHGKQWVKTLDDYAMPVLGHLPVAEITSADVLRCIEPIWARIPDTASRVRERIARIMDYSTSRGWRAGDNPAGRGIMETLPKKSKVKKPKRHAAMPYAEIPAFLAQLRERDSLPALALEFTTLTVARTSEIIGALWPEFDLDARVWTVPAGRMKADRPHRVPLCDLAVKILRSLPRLGPRPFPLHAMHMLSLMWELRDGYTVHGLRSSFRDWCAERTSYPREVCEAALAHAIGDKTEAAYNRTDLFERRRHLMDAWQAFCCTPPAAEGAKVVNIRQ